jgi:hypothetical protein
MFAEPHSDQHAVEDWHRAPIPSRYQDSAVVRTTSTAESPNFFSTLIAQYASNVKGNVEATLFFMPIEPM